MRFHEKLQAESGKKGWSQADLARKAGVSSKSTMSNYWKGATSPDYQVAFRLARALGVSLDYLADDDAPEPDPARARLISELLRNAELVGLEVAVRRVVNAPESKAPPGLSYGEIEAGRARGESH